jgi:hypothetical protein
MMVGTPFFVYLTLTSDHDRPAHAASTCNTRHSESAAAAEIAPEMGHLTILRS